MTNTELTDRVEELLPQLVTDLTELIAIPSISSVPEHATDVRKAQEKIVSWLLEIGAADAQIVQEGGQPAVIAHFPAPPGKPTVLLYAHSDVQPFGEISDWSSAPTHAVIRNGRLYARGSADDKNGVMAHIAALRAFNGKPPVGVTVFIEGEEEIGSPTVAQILNKHRDVLAADVFVISDASNWDSDHPTITNTLRGIGECVVTVRTLDHGVHSGEFGGVVPDALTTLCRLLATLHDEQGNVAVAGIKRFPAPDLEYPTDRLAEETGKLPATTWIGTGSVVERLWTSPSISVLGIDTTNIAQASNTLIPQASAKIGLRVAPGDDAAAALQHLVSHLEAHVPWGAQIEITALNSGEPSIIATDGSAAQAMREAMTEVWGSPPVLMGMGGSIPMIKLFQETFPAAEVLCVGSCDATSRIHGVNESLDLELFRKYVLAQTLLLEKLKAL
ncbi:MAG: dipeptidase [Propionibacteriaceae bacterium]|nr:dipeptidase [Propionibacteriaceae bacterium]